MSRNILQQLTGNRLLEKISNLENIYRELRTKQTIGSDLSAPIKAGVVITSDYTLNLSSTWEDVTGLTTNITITEPSYIIVYMSCVMYWVALLGGYSLMEARMVWDGTATGKHAKFYAAIAGTVTDLTNVQQCVLITANTAGTYTLKMQAIGWTEPLIVGDDTNFAYFVFKQ